MNPPCPRCGAGCSQKYGRYHRYDDAQSIQRYRCKSCGKCHSSATHAPTYRQKRRRLNREIEQDICCSTAQRRIAIKHRCARKTVARKIVFLAQQARDKSAKWLDAREPFEHVQWDELISFEHSRLKPLSVAVMCAVGDRCILGFGVAQCPVGGKIAKRAKEKYGPRRNFSVSMRKRVLREVEPYLVPNVHIESDEHRDYPREIKKVLPKAQHSAYKSKRGSLTGQGELKRTGYDPLFAINHTLAMMRDNIKRLTRRTWCTTKKKSALEDVIAIYLHYHNTKLIPDVPINKSENAEVDEAFA